jgi:hypothetical protein
MCRAMLTSSAAGLGARASTEAGPSHGIATNLRLAKGEA